MNILQNRQNADSDRTEAASLLGEYVVTDDRTTGALLSVVQNAREPERLRARAAISLGPALEDADNEGFDDELSEPAITEPVFRRVREGLRKIYGDSAEPEIVRRCVLEASVRAPEDWHADAVREAYSSGDPQWKLTAVFCMGYIRGFDRQILESLESRDLDIHRLALRAAANWEIEPAWPHVAGLLTSKKTEKELLLDAIGAAAFIAPREAGGILSELAASDDEEIAEAASEALLESQAGNFDEDDFDDEEDGEDEDSPR